ncbi:MlaE family lipid ABC transporter permease subunit [Campylobacter novaezeelandiae]|uniref:ABC transporter permease n=1 Tax=Campylobacter novaezeelandiae TaxID=2267891 RepID=UPI0010371ADC|nr:ABC transporter permease [Campylobacter novaezeelandiae]TBR79286.1 MlaE family lipid ABC transporter permease subunit [Campylobacter novaezeelandiae]TBR80209.1 MlaE family lipid ABC transporter permease subunit [Campylobacter novaezeelandiae]
MSCYFKLQEEENLNKLLIFGIWDKTNLPKIKFHKQLNQKNVVIDFTHLDFIDTAGVRFFLALEHDLTQRNIKVQKLNLNSNFSHFFTLCEKNYTRIYPKKQSKLSYKDCFISIGVSSINLLKTFRQFFYFLGAFFSSLFFCITNPKKFRFIAFLYHIEDSILKALPIVILTAFLVGVVLAYQAAYQLAQFGANIFIVDLIGISATRELAPLIAAIIIAGRSASSYTAQIGVMKITDEIAAMNTMGFNSFDFIVIPRVMALVCAMPLIVIISDIVSILGGIIIAKLSLDINAGEFLRRFREAIDFKNILIGIIKAPIFGFLIGIISNFRGFNVAKTTQSIGIYTTKSVVDTIFWIIAFNAIFSVFLTKIGF